MASGLFSGGVDLDTLFMARVNAKRADVGIKVAGVDISNRYETIGGASPIAATGFKAAGTDLASLFRNIAVPLGTHTLTSVHYNIAAGYDQYGLVAGVGSIAPTTFGGYAILTMYDQVISGDPGNSGFTVEIASPASPGYFTTIVINGHTYTSASAVYDFNGSWSYWFWPTPSGIVGGVNYPVTFT